MRAVLLAALVVLAGCSGFAGSGDPTETVTPVPELPDEPVYPPGVTGSGVMDPGAVASAHADEVADVSYTLLSARTVRAENGTLLSHFTVQVELDDDHSYRARARTEGPAAPKFLGRPPATAVFWSDGETYLRTLAREGTTTYDELDPGSQVVPTWRYWTGAAAFGDRSSSAITTIRDVLAAFTWRVGTAERGNTTDYRLESEAYTAGTVGPPEVTDVRNATATVTVTEPGLVRSIRLRYVGTIDGNPVAIERTVEYDAVGNTTVERPEWADRATNQTDP